MSHILIYLHNITKYVSRIFPNFAQNRLGLLLLLIQGSSGLGGATASYLIKYGARVIVADLPGTFEALSTKTSLHNNATRCNLRFAKADVTSEDDVSLALDMAEKEFGEQGR